MKIKKNLIKQNIKQALLEDGYKDDLSLQFLNLFNKNKSKAILTAKQEGFLSGKIWFEETFKFIDKKTSFKWNIEEGERFKKNQDLMIMMMLELAQVYG